MDIGKDFRTMVDTCNEHGVHMAGLTVAFIGVAIEKQSPKKPITTASDEKAYHICPQCESAKNIKVEMKHCPNCGQKLNWR